VVVVVDALVVVPPLVDGVVGFGAGLVVSSPPQPTRNKLRTNRAPANSFITKLLKVKGNS
jgi:hypothetical protein